MKGAALLIWIALAGIASFALFNITYKVQQLESELNALNKQILKEQKSIHVLRAEWSYLNRPDRIEALARRLLPDLGTPNAAQIGGLEQLAEPPRTARAATAGTALRPASLGSKP